MLKRSATARNIAYAPAVARAVLHKTFHRLRRQIRKAAKPLPTSHWTSYATKSDHYSKGDRDQKYAFALRVFERFRPLNVLDIGANTGEYSILASQCGAQQIVACDTDEAAVEQLWRSRSSNLPIQPLVVDFARLTPATGWENCENLSFLEHALGFWAAIILAQLLFLSLWQPAAWSLPAGDPPAIHSAGRHGRVVWILFDELAFEQTYGHRDMHLALPNLDAIRQQSTLYTQVSPVGDSTELVVPALLLGKQLSRVRYRYENRLEIVPAGDSAWRPYSAPQTLFAEARALGFKDGIVGWYNPYCSLLVGQWDSCFWTSTLSLATSHLGMSADARIFENIGSLAGACALMTVALQVYKQRRLASDAKAGARENELLIEQARKLLSQASFDFVFIHLSVPHPPPFYKRCTKRFGPGGSYLDGLALMDLALGDLVDQMKSSLQWPQTSIVISGDHSYRVPQWRQTRFWTPEDERTTHGVFDDRPLLLIHRAGQQLPETVNSPTSLMVVHSVLEEMLRQNSDTLAGVSGPAHSDSCGYRTGAKMANNHNVCIEVSTMRYQFKGAPPSA